MADLVTTLVASDADRLLQAEAVVRSFCGWHIAPSREETVEVRTCGGRTLLLPSMYVTAVESVTADEQALTTDDFHWSTAGVVTHSDWWGSGVTSVVFTHGYDEVPAEVTAIVQAVAQRATANPGSLTRQQIGPFSETYSTTGSGQVVPLGLLDAEKDLLRRYRIPALA